MNILFLEIHPFERLHLKTDLYTANIQVEGSLPLDEGWEAGIKHAIARNSSHPDVHPRNDSHPFVHRPDMDGQESDAIRGRKYENKPATQAAGVHPLLMKLHQ